MSEVKYLNKEFIEWLKKKNTKTTKKCLKELNRDIILIAEYRGIKEINQVNKNKPIPNYLYNEVLRFKESGNWNENWNKRFIYK